MALEIYRKQRTLQATGLGNSALYLRITEGLFTPGVPISKRAVGWPSCEVEAINRARVAGVTDEELRALVQRLIARRKKLASDVGGAE